MFADCLHSAFARRPLGMGTVIDVPNAGKAYSDPRARAFGDFRTKADEEGLNIRPRNVGTRRLSEDSFQGTTRLCIHSVMILQNGTKSIAG